MPTNITREELKTERDRLQVSIAKLEIAKTKALDERLISVSQFREINADQLAMENQLNILNVQLIIKTIESISVGDDSPAAKLSTSVDKLNEAIDRLENLSGFFNAVANVVGSISAIASILIDLAI